jgi:regulator of replication initiation timing
MQGRERVVGRDAYDQLLRENQFLRIEKREKDNELQRSLAYNQQLERENEELRRSTGTSTDADSRKAKLKEARKKNARLEVDVDNLKDQVSQWRRLYEEAIRRIDIMRENLNSHIEEEARLERENATLKRSARRHGF